MSEKIENITTIVRERIRDGEYQPNRRVPSQAELAEEFHVSGRIIARAVADLRDRGYLWTLPHKGSYAGAHEHWQDAEADTSV